MIQIDEIGILYAPSPADDGGDVAAPPPLAGWHVNATHQVAGWAAYLATPETPRRVFGGAPTVCYAFPSQADFQRLLADVDLIVPAAVPVPPSISMRQARLALLGAGKLALVDPAINGMPEPQKSVARIEWDYANEVRRSSELVEQLASALGLDGGALDALFVQAAAL